MPMSPRLLRPRAAGGFNPKTISGLVGWYDASSTSSITRDGNGKVQTWADISGAATVRNATQSTSGSRPAYTSAGLNGKNVVTFDGSSSFMSFTGVSRTDETLVAVCSASVVASVNKQNPLVGDASNGFGLNASIAGNASPVTYNAFFDAGGSVNLVTRSLVTGETVSPFPAVLSVARNAAESWSLRRNGAVVGSTASTSSAVTLARFGSSGGLRLNGFLAEVLIWDRKLSASELATVERALGRKWGIAVS